MQAIASSTLSTMARAARLISRLYNQFSVTLVRCPHDAIQAHELDDEDRASWRDLLDRCCFVVAASLFLSNVMMRLLALSSLHGQVAGSALDIWFRQVLRETRHSLRQRCRAVSR